MRFKPALTVVGIACLIAEIGVSGAAAAWTFRDGDRVALIGGTFIEREQRYGYLETALTIANPDKTITFRNLGWSGDTVGGVSRSGFDPPEAGFKQLVDQVNAVRPTVIIAGYGANESFAGKEGLDAFTKGLERLTDALKPTRARFIFLAPLKQENLGPPLPDPEKHNRDVELYSKAVEEHAKRINADFVTIDPYTTEVGSTVGVRLTDNGVHLTALGYWTLANSLGMPSSVTAKLQEPRAGRLKLDDVKVSLDGTPGDHLSITDAEKTQRGLRFRVKIDPLRMPSAPTRSVAVEAANPQRILTVDGLDDGRFRLEIDGQAVCVGSSREWSQGMAVPDRPDLDQVEQLRKTIIRKNQLFFHRWRPQNITYLLGFRKHEQGNNAVEIPQFDPLVEEQEKKIGELKKPVPHVYELIREDAKGASK